MGITISQLHAEDLASWPETRLRVWARDVPIILIHALPGEGLDEQARRLFPRPRGFYTEEDLAGVAHYTVSAQASASHSAWSALLAWSGALYREYRARTGKHHPGHTRTAWLAIACQPILTGAKMEPITTAQKISSTYGDDGQSFFRQDTHIDTMASHHCAYAWGRFGETIYFFEDGSVLGVSLGGWDILQVIECEPIEAREVTHGYRDSNGITWAVCDTEDHLWSECGQPFSWRRA